MRPYFKIETARGRVCTLEPGEFMAWPAQDEEGDSDLLVVKSDNGDELGIQFNSDGTFQLGGWDDEGVWVDLVLRAPCEHSPYCKAAGHTKPFPLNQCTQGKP